MEVSISSQRTRAAATFSSSTLFVPSSFQSLRRGLELQPTKSCRSSGLLVVSISSQRTRAAASGYFSSKPSISAFQSLRRGLELQQTINERMASTVRHKFQSLRRGLELQLWRSAIPSVHIFYQKSSRISWFQSLRRGLELQPTPATDVQKIT